MRWRFAGFLNLSNAASEGSREMPRWTVDLGEAGGLAVNGKIKAARCAGWGRLESPGQSTPSRPAGHIAAKAREVREPGNPLKRNGSARGAPAARPPGCAAAWAVA